MTLHEKLREQLKDAMRGKDVVRVTVIRSLMAASTNELVATRRKLEEILTNEQTLAVIRRAVKQRKDSIDQFTKGKRPDLAANEQAELKILEAYLPAQMARDEIEKAAKARATALGVTDKTGANKLMRMLMRELKGKADGTLTKEVVDSLFT